MSASIKKKVAKIGQSIATNKSISGPNFTKSEGKVRFGQIYPSLTLQTAKFSL